MEYKGYDLTVYKSLARTCLDIFEKKLDPVQVRELLADYEELPSKELEDNLAKAFIFRKAMPSPYINIFFKDKSTPIKVEGRFIFYRRAKEGQFNYLSRLWRNLTLKFTINTHFNSRIFKLRKRLGKPTKNKDFVYWEDNQKVVVVFKVFENETSSNEIILAVYDKSYFSNQFIFESVIKMKNHNYPNPNAGKFN